MCAYLDGHHAILSCGKFVQSLKSNAGRNQSHGSKSCSYCGVACGGQPMVIHERFSQRDYYCTMECYSRKIDAELLMN